MRERHPLGLAELVAQVDGAPVGDLGHREARHLAEQLVGIERGRQQGAAVGQEALRHLGALVRGDVLDHVDRHRDRAAAVEDRRGLDRGPALLAGRSHAEAHDRLGRYPVREGAPARAAPGPGTGAPSSLSMSKRSTRLSAGAASSSSLELEAERLDGGVVREQQLAVGSLRGDAVGHAAQDRLELFARLVGVEAGELLEAQQLLALLLVRLAPGDVAHRAGEHGRLAGADAVDRDLDRELAAVGPHAQQLEAPPEDRRLAGLDVARQRPAVRRSQRRGDDQLRHLAADHVRRLATEDPLGRGVPFDHVSAVVHDHHAVERRCEHRGLARLALAHGLDNPLTLHELADLVLRGSA